MDDLSGLDWIPGSTQTSIPQKPPPMNPPSYYPALRSTPPLSGRSTPPTAQLPVASKSSASGAPRSNSATPVNDSFANLVAFNASQSVKSVSLREQQQVLEQKRAASQAHLNTQLKADTGGHDEEFWDRLGDGRITPNRVTAPPSYAGTDEYGSQKLSNTINKPFALLRDTSGKGSSTVHTNGEIDLLSAFDPSPYLHKPNAPDIKNNGGLGQKSSGMLQETLPSQSSPEEHSFQNVQDEDPFGLGRAEAGNFSTNKKDANEAGDEDILGLLGRPVSEFSPPVQQDEPSSESQTQGSPSPSDHALAELLDMGFSIDKSKEALQSTANGVDVQAAVGWILNQAHDDSKKKSQTRPRRKSQESHDTMSRSRRSLTQSPSPDDDAPRPAWMREQDRSNESGRRLQSRSPINGEKDSGKFAADLGNNLFKTANSLWKTGAKKLNNVVSELNSDSDSGQPKWMTASQAGAEGRRSRPQERQRERLDYNGSKNVPNPLSGTKESSVTDEALMLESGHIRSAPRKPRQLKAAPSGWSSESSRDQSPTVAKSRDRTLPQSKFLQQPRANDIKAKLTRQANEEQSSTAYVSPARRKKAAVNPSSSEPDLLFDATQVSTQSSSHTLKSKPSTIPDPHVLVQSQLPGLSKPQSRTSPQVSSSALQLSTNNRLEGTSAFKRGDYALATTYYTSALSPLPATHSLAIVILTNRALAYLNTGDPKSAIADTKSALAIIGPAKGHLETIDLDGESPKEMKSFWGKAMMRQAEAFEQLERWSDAAATWKSCVEAGVGGANSIAGRNRCEKATVGPIQPSQFSKTAALRKPTPKPIPKTSALSDLTDYGGQEPSAKAVTRLRQANLDAERLDDEKFALSDQVSERLSRWRAGKEGNLRALLASLETVLWEGAGWKKVGMGELIVPGKVKIVYMRGIGRVHPDKVTSSLSFTFDQIWKPC